MNIEITFDELGQPSFDFYPNNINDSIYLQYMGMRPLSSFGDMKNEAKIDKVIEGYDSDYP